MGCAVLSRHPQSGAVRDVWAASLRTGRHPHDVNPAESRRESNWDCPKKVIFFYKKSYVLLKVKILFLMTNLNLLEYARNICVS